MLVRSQNECFQKHKTTLFTHIMWSSQIAFFSILQALNFLALGLRNWNVHFHVFSWYFTCVTEWAAAWLVVDDAAEKNVAAETFLVHLTINLVTRAFLSVPTFAPAAASVVSGAAPLAPKRTPGARLSGSLKRCDCHINLSPLARRGVCYYLLLV